MTPHLRPDPRLPQPSQGSPIQLRSFLDPVASYYPGFDEWFWLSVVPEIGFTRAVFTEDVDGSVAGAVIAKRDAHEQKLCTVWVAPRFQSRGIGRALVETALEWLGTCRPLMTAPEERTIELRPLLQRFGFAETCRHRGLYRPGRDEVIYNRGTA